MQGPAEEIKRRVDEVTTKSFVSSHAVAAVKIDVCGTDEMDGCT